MRWGWGLFSVSLISRIPLLQCLTTYSKENHLTASKKFIALWLLTSLPVIVAAILSPIPIGEGEVSLKFLSKLREAITVSELFVYTATFLTPILYMIVEKYTSIPKDRLGEQIVKGVRGIFTGYSLVALMSLLTIILTAIAFGQIKASADSFQHTFLSYYLTEYAATIYFFSLYCWYLTILDGTWSGNFVESNRQSEDLVSLQFSDRLRKREASNE